MNKTVLTLVMTLLLAVVSGADMAKEWGQIPWEGYKPFASYEFNEDGLHIYNVESKNGFGWRSPKQFAAVAGDEVIITAKIKGKGEIAFQLQYFTADGRKWIGIGLKTATAVLKNDWQEESFPIRVENLKDGITGKVILTFNGKKETELYIKEITMKVVQGN